MHTCCYTRIYTQHGNALVRRYVRHRIYFQNTQLAASACIPEFVDNKLSQYRPLALKQSIGERFLCECVPTSALLRARDSLSLSLSLSLSISLSVSLSTLTGKKIAKLNQFCSVSKHSTRLYWLRYLNFHRAYPAGHDTL